MLPGARIPRGPPKAPGAPRPSSDEDIPPTGEIPRMTKSARQLANLTAANWSTSANWRTSSPPTGEISQNDQVPPPTGQPRRRQLARSLKMTKSARQLVNLTAANWSTSSPPTGQPLPTGEDHPPTGEPRRRQLVNLTGANWSTSSAPTGEPHRRQLANLTGANWRTSSSPTGQPHRRQLGNLIAANWSTSSPPTGKAFTNWRDPSNDQDNPPTGETPSHASPIV